MKSFLLILFLFSNSLYAQAGNFELVLDGKQVSSGKCETYTRDNVQGIKFTLRTNVSLFAEIDLNNESIIQSNNDEFTLTQNGLIPSAGFCSVQEFLTELKLIYTKNNLFTSFEYLYYCGGNKLSKKIICHY